MPTATATTQPTLTPTTATATAEWGRPSAMLSSPTGMPMSMTMTRSSTSTRTSAMGITGMATAIAPEGRRGLRQPHRPLPRHTFKGWP